MNIRQQHFIRPGGAMLLMVFVALVAGCGGGGGGGGSSTSSTSMVSIAGTAATGKALANATISIDCARGSMSVAADANGNYHATLSAVTPCVISATSGGTMLHSVAFAGGTYNVTPETDLLLSFLAAQLGTNESGLIAGFALNAQFQQTLQNQTEVLTAQTAVVQNLQQMYGVTLSTPNFLTTSFAVGQPGEDSDLEALLAHGAIDANGEPDAAAVTLMSTMGAAHPIAPPASSTGGTGGTGVGGTGSAGGMM
jgi:enamine deaminase RidA (YjgF/YER057c/UK114 family)